MGTNRPHSRLASPAERPEITPAAKLEFSKQSSVQETGSRSHRTYASNKNTKNSLPSDLF